MTGGLDFVLQEPQLGTGHAVMMAAPALKGHQGDILILNGDVPGLKLNTLRKLIKTHQSEANALTVLGMDLKDPAHYGRLVEAPGGAGLARIVESRGRHRSAKKNNNSKCRDLCCSARSHAGVSAPIIHRKRSK